MQYCTFLLGEGVLFWLSFSLCIFSLFIHFPVSEGLVCWTWGGLFGIRFRPPSFLFFFLGFCVCPVVRSAFSASPAAVLSDNNKKRREDLLFWWRHLSVQTPPVPERIFLVVSSTAPHARLVSPRQRKKNKIKARKTNAEWRSASFFLPSPSEKFTQKFIGRKRRSARVSRGFGAVADGRAGQAGKWERRPKLLAALISRSPGLLYVVAPLFYIRRMDIKYRSLLFFSLSADGTHTPRTRQPSMCCSCCWRPHITAVFPIFSPFRNNKKIRKNVAKSGFRSEKTQSVSSPLTGEGGELF